MVSYMAPREAQFNPHGAIGVVCVSWLRWFVSLQSHGFEAFSNRYRLCRVDDEFLHGDINSYHSSSQNRNVRAREPKG